MTWDPRTPPSQAGTTIVVTGGNAGVGYFTSEQLAAAGARVVLASRSAEKAQLAIDSIRERVPAAALEFVRLDLTSLASVAEAAHAIRALGPIDVLINNAGLVVAKRTRQLTEDGLELTVGGNFLGHFALTAQLWSGLTPTGRVVGLGSDSTRMVRLQADDLLSEKKYRPFRAYAFSKHAVQGFAFELDRRIRAADESRLSLLAHPGYSVNAIASKRPGITDRDATWQRIGETVSGIVAQGKDRGAWPSVRAATDPEAQSGEYYGPQRQLSGPPVITSAVTSSAEPEFGRMLWQLAEQKTGVRFSV